MRTVIQTGGLRVIARLYGAIKTVRTHESDNQASRAAAETLREALAELARSQPKIELVFVEGQAYVNNVRLRLDSTSSEQVARVSAQLQSRELGGLVFEDVPDPSAVSTVIRLLLRPVESRGDADAIRRELDRLPGVRGVGLTSFSPESALDAEVLFDRRLFALQTYGKLVVAGREGRAAIAEGHDPFAQRVSPLRLAQDLADLVLERPAFLMKLAALPKPPDDYPGRHAAATTIWSALIGRALGLERAELADLAQAAIFADAGLYAASGEGEESTSPRPTESELSADDRAERLRDLAAAARVLLLSGGLGPATLIRALVAVEHHESFQDPVSRTKRRLHLYSRIVAVADAYDALTSKRPWRAAFAPDHAAKTLRGEAGFRFDPIAVKALVGLLGSFPPGALCELRSGAIAIVVGPGADPARPALRMVLDPRGEIVREAPIVELSESGAEIARQLPNDALGLEAPAAGLW